MSRQWTVTTDNGDGTGVRTTYEGTGQVVSVEQLTNLTIPEPEPVDPYVTYAEAIATAQTMEEVRAAGAALAEALGGA